MTDVLTPDQRSYNMSRIRSVNTGPEVKLRALLYAEGLRGYRLHSKISGRPDIVFTRKRVAVFIDGCFWHGCPRCFKLPATRVAFWKQKIEANIARDAAINADLRKAEWKVLRIWEHDLRKRPERVVQRILKTLSAIHL